MQIPYLNRNSYQTMTPTRNTSLMNMSLMNTSQTRVRTHSIVNMNPIPLISIIKSFHLVLIINVNMVLDINPVIADVEINLNNIVDIKKPYHYQCCTKCYKFFILNWCVNYRMYDCIPYTIHEKNCVCKPYEFA